MSVFGPDACLLVGVGPDEADGSMRVYLDARWRGLHTHVSDPEGKAQVRRAWAGGYRSHTFVAVPHEHRCNCPEPEQEVGDDA